MKGAPWQSQKSNAIDGWYFQSHRLRIKKRESVGAKKEKCNRTILPAVGWGGAKRLTMYSLVNQVTISKARFIGLGGLKIEEARDRGKGVGAGENEGHPKLFNQPKKFQRRARKGGVRRKQV